VVPVADDGIGTLGGLVFERRAAKKRHSAGPVEGRRLPFSLAEIAQGSGAYHRSLHQLLLMPECLHPIILLALPVGY
jgi:hypothetical protein